MATKEEKKINSEIEKMKEELCLLLILLTGWEEEKANEPGKRVFRALKSYSEEILTELEKQQLILQLRDKKSLHLSEAGLAKGKKLREKYLSQFKQGSTQAEKVKTLNSQNMEKCLEINLLLIFLTGWEEDKKNAPGKKVFRAWKWYRFEILNDMEQKRLIHQIPGGRSLLLTVPGKEKAEELMKKYFSVKNSQ